MMMGYHPPAMPPYATMGYHPHPAPMAPQGYHLPYMGYPGGVGPAPAPVLPQAGAGAPAPHGIPYGGTGAHPPYGGAAPAAAAGLPGTRAGPGAPQPGPGAGFGSAEAQQQQRAAAATTAAPATTTELDHTAVHEAPPRIVEVKNEVKVVADAGTQIQSDLESSGGPLMLRIAPEKEVEQCAWELINKAVNRQLQILLPKVIKDMAVNVIYEMQAERVLTEAIARLCRKIACELCGIKTEEEPEETRRKEALGAQTEIEKAQQAQQFLLTEEDAEQMKQNPIAERLLEQLVCQTFVKETFQDSDQQRKSQLQAGLPLDAIALQEVREILAAGP